MLAIVINIIIDIFVITIIITITIICNIYVYHKKVCVWINK